MARGHKKGTLFGKKRSSIIKHPGSETKRAEENGRSVHEQAEVDRHSPNKHIRGKGTFALNAEHFHHKGNKRRRGKRTISVRSERRRVARKAA